MNTESQTEPKAEVSTTTSPKEQTMETQQSSKPSDSAAGTSTDSTETSQAKTGKGRGKDQGKRKERRPDYDPTEIEGEANTVLDDTSGIKEDAVQADRAAVEARVAEVKSASGTVATMAGKTKTARSAWQGIGARVIAALVPVTATLTRVTPGGRDFYRRCRKRQRTMTALNVLEHLPPGNLGLEQALVDRLKASTAEAEALQQALTQAKENEATAVQGYKTAKARLEAAIATLRASAHLYRLRQANAQAEQQGPAGSTIAA